MVITPFHTQKILEAYNQQLTMKTRVSPGKAKVFIPKDVITLSEEGKRRLEMERVSQGVVKDLTLISPPHPPK